MAITLVAAATAEGAGGATVTKPTGTVEGDVLLALVAGGYDSSSSLPGAPSGWVQITNESQPTESFEIATFYKVAGASEGASYAFTAAAGDCMAAVATFRDVDVSAPIMASSSAPATAVASLTLPAVTTIAANAMVVALAAQKTISSWTSPAGMTEAVDVSGSLVARNVLVAYVVQATVGTTGTKTATGAGGAPKMGALIALKQRNQPPNAPTLVSPVGGVSIDLALTQRLSFTPSDDDDGDSQSKFDLRYRPATGGTWTDITQTTPNSFYDLPAGTLTAGDYEWQVRTYDALGVVGPYSSSAFFTAAAVSNDITITSPTNGATISTDTFTVTWSTPTQTHYQLRVVADLAGAPDTSTVIYDTGEITSSGARSRQVAYPDNGVTRHTQVRKRQDGLWSDWASVSNLISYTPPAVPTITVDDTSLAGAIQAQAAHPTPVGDQPTVSSVTWWRRRAKMDANGGFVEWFDTARDPGGESGFAHRDGSELAPSAIFTDWFVNGAGYSYRVQAHGANGTSSYSEWSDDGSGVVTGFYGGGYGEAS